MELKELLEERYHKFNTMDFIESDPISIPHLFSKKENIEISGFLTATISWGQRPTIIRNAKKLMELLDNDPYNFIKEASASDMKGLESFVHRTFNGVDLKTFILCLRNIYKNYQGLEALLTDAYNKDGDVKGALEIFHKLFFSIDHPSRTQKHLANVAKGASAKRLNMFLRWMVREDNSGVDFGIWKGIPTSALYLPLDVHTGNISRDLGLLSRKQNDWKAVEEVTENLRKFDVTDPVKYDFALFGMGVFEKKI